MTSRGKNRNSNEYIKFGFTLIHVRGSERPQCLSVLERFLLITLNPVSLECDPELEDKDLAFFIM